ncbi:dipeptidase [Woeseia oceani]|uniref:Dipeptidase n=1 Tax=Woeseia oceani TaxID=1548547 RepID=A0A193LDE4_9GAMM|nr:dipeptidase [Woeseia oceani]ANO50550.1 dipeptidase [Woeseia oceani]
MSWNSILQRAGLRAVACALLLSSCTLAFADMDKSVADTFSVELSGGSYAGFDEFLQAAETLDVGKGVDIKTLRNGYRDEQGLTASQRNTLYRLLGIYARLKYGDEAMQMLAELVAIPTFEVESLPQTENPEFQRFAKALENIAKDFGLAFRNVGGQVYEVTLGEPRGELIGLHAHADVVPVNPDLWVLDDGTRLDPFKVTRIGNRMYGRGTQDDKNGIVVTLYAMRIVQDEQLPLLHHFRLLVDTREETGGDAIPWYFESNPVPDYNIALDGDYPVVIAEKGYGVVMASFPARATTPEGAAVVEVTGGLATNQIPAQSTAWIRTAAPEVLVTTLKPLGDSFAAEHGGNFSVGASVDSRGVRLDVIGVSAHSSDPGSGINPVSRMFALLDKLRSEGVLEANHYTDAARYATENWGLDYLGTRAGIAYSDPFMGPLTAAQTFVSSEDDQLRTAVNLRLPIGRQPGELVSDLQGRLETWAASNDIDVEFQTGARDPMYRNPEGAWVNALLDVAVENLNIPREFGSSAGGTSIHDLPNGVQFGLSRSDEKYTGHNAGEFKTVDQFLLDLSIVTEMIARLGGMREL